MRRNQQRSLFLSALICLLTATAALHAALPQLWPTFSEPSNIVNVGLSGQSGDDFMAIVSFAGAYNQQQLSTRLYVNAAGDANYWLAHAVPSSVSVTNLSYNSNDADGSLKSLLSTYGPQGTGKVTKYVICDPVNIPESCNMAATLAGIDDAMVVNPDNLSVISSYGLTQDADLRVYPTPASGQYTWIGTTSDLVNNNSSAYGTTNMVSNPSGGNGTTGWSGSGTLSTTTFSGQQAIEWQLPANQGGDRWTSFKPSIQSLRVNTTPYIFSFRVAGSGTVFIDVWNGCSDVQSSTLNLTSSYQTIQMAVPTVVSGCTGNSAIQIQLRAHVQTGAVTAYFNNAAVVDNRLAVDYYQYKNLLASTTHLVMSQHNAGNNNLRDYEIAAKMFVFDLTSDGAYSEEKGLYQCILTNATSCGPPNYPVNHVTPIMGYIDHEIEDTQFMSDATTGNGHFLNASDNYNNGSVWASMPQPPSLSQPSPGGIKTTNGTVYVAFAMSDGDNLSFVEHQNQGRSTGNNYFGAVPMAWTIVPSMIDFAPGIIGNFFSFLPQSQEMMGGPSGVGYTRQINGNNISTLASYTSQFMSAENMSTVTNWANSQGDFNTYSTDLNEPHSLWGSCAGYGTLGHLPTVTDGQCVGYQNTAVEQVYNTSNTPGIEKWLSTNYAGSGAPTFLEALNSNFNIPPDDTLWVAQQLQLHSGYNYVFLTPSELALTEQAYKNGTGSSLPANNAQAVAGSRLTSAFPQNVLYNAQGQSGNYGLSSTGWALGSTGHGEYLFNTIYQGGGANELVVPANAGVTCYVYEYLGNGQLGGGTLVTGRYYRFSVSVAGSGNAQMTIYDGTTNNHSAIIPLTSSWQTITMIVKMNSATAGQIQVGVTSSSSRQTLYFNSGTSQPIAWYYNPPSSSGGLVSAGGTNYNNGSFDAQAMYFGVPASQSSSQWISQHPGDTAALSASTSYTATVDVAGGTTGGQAYLDLWNGSSDTTSSTVNLTQQWQTLKATYTSGSTPSNDQWQVRVPANNSAAETVYFRNASLVPTSSIPNYGFITGLESGETQLNWTNTVDTTSPGGGESNVTSALTQSSSTITRGGGNAIQYGGTAGGGSSTNAYLEAFSNSTTLNSNSRLSYWIYPMTPMGSESGASSTTGLNSTCVAIDIIFTDGTALRNITTVTDQFGNQMHPAHQCNHLQPDQWNYVTADLSGISGKIVSRIDIGYDQPGASGNYGGYMDDITLSH
jgi:hypothetical protein